MPFKPTPITEGAQGISQRWKPAYITNNEAKHNPRAKGTSQSWYASAASVVKLLLFQQPRHDITGIMTQSVLPIALRIDVDHKRQNTQAATSSACTVRKLQVIDLKALKRYLHQGCGCAQGVVEQHLLNIKISTIMNQMLIALRPRTADGEIVGKRKVIKAGHSSQHSARVLVGLHSRAGRKER